MRMASSILSIVCLSACMPTDANPAHQSAAARVHLDDEPPREAPATRALEPADVDAIRARGPEMYCTPADRPDRAVALAELADGTVVARIADGSAPCSYTLALVDPERKEVVEVLGEGLGVYDARVVEGTRGDVLVAFTDVRGRDWRPASRGRFVTTDVRVMIQAVVRPKGGQWSAPRAVVAGAGAAWLASLEVDDEGVRLRYWADSLFERLLFTQEGRPDSDGLFEASLTWGSDAELAIADLRRLGDYALESRHLPRE